LRRFAGIDQPDDQRVQIDRHQIVDHLDKQPTSINDPIALP